MMNTSENGWIPSLSYRRTEEQAYYHVYLTLENGSVHKVADIYKCNTPGVEWRVSGWPNHVGFGLGGCARNGGSSEGKASLLADAKILLIKRLQDRRKSGWLNSAGY